MVELIDTPLLRDKKSRRRWTPWALFAVGLLLLTAMAWGNGNYVHMGTMNGLEAQVLFMNYQSISPKGEYLYRKDQPIDYRITVRNRSNSSFNQVNLGASLHSDGSECSEDSLISGGRLPGNSLSPYQTTPLAPGQSYLIEGSYAIPSSLCSTSGHLQLRLQMEQRGTRKAETMVSPVHFHIE